MLLAAAGLGILLAAAQTAQRIAPEGYVDLIGLWDSPANIPVCWELSAEPYTQEKGWVAGAVVALIADVSSVHFRDWNDCSPQVLGIRIKIADENPTSHVGRQWSRDSAGLRRRDNNGQYIQLPTRMVLNFVFDFHPAYRDICKPDREHCIRALAVHEFLHSIGFLHEQLRADAPRECRERYAHRPDARGFQPVYATQDYDSDSHMNYCANMYRKPIQLSKGDEAVLRRFYPKP
jgi:hypothetical protein